MANHAESVLRDARSRSRETRTTTWTLLYGGVLVALMCGATGLAAVRAAAGSVSEAGTSAWLPFPIGAAWLCGLLALCLALGPAHAQPATAQWLLAAPLDRALVLRRGLRVTRVGAAVFGAMGGAVLACTSGSARPEWAAVLVLVIGGTLVGAAVHQGSLWIQGRGSTRTVRAAAHGGAVIAALTVTVGVRAGVTWRLEAFTPAVGAVLVVASLVVLGLSWRRSPSWTRAVTASSARDAGAVVQAALVGAMTLDSTAFQVRAALSSARRPAGSPSIGVRRFRHASVFVDHVVRDAVAARRRIDALGARMLWIPGVWALGALLRPAFGDAPSVLAAAFVVWSLVAASGRSLSTWLGSSSLWRLLPTRPQVVTWALSLVPVTVGAVTGIVALAGAGIDRADAAWWGVTLALAAVAGVARRADPPPVHFENMISTPLGDVPPGLILAVLYGPDIVALSCALGWAVSPTVGCVAAAGCLAWAIVTVRPGGRERG